MGIYTCQEMYFLIRIGMMDYFRLEQERISGQNGNLTFFVFSFFTKGMLFTATELYMLFIGNKRFY